MNIKFGITYILIISSLLNNLQASQDPNNMDSDQTQHVPSQFSDADLELFDIGTATLDTSTISTSRVLNQTPVNSPISSPQPYLINFTDAQPQETETNQPQPEPTASQSNNAIETSAQIDNSLDIVASIIIYQVINVDPARFALLPHDRQMLILILIIHYANQMPILYKHILLTAVIDLVQNLQRIILAEPYNIQAASVQAANTQPNNNINNNPAAIDQDNNLVTNVSSTDATTISNSNSADSSNDYIITRYRCTCGLSYATARGLHRHTINYQNNYFCRYCNHHAHTAGQLTNHVYDHHPEQSVTI